MTFVPRSRFRTLRLYVRLHCTLACQPVSALCYGLMASPGTPASAHSQPWKPLQVSIRELKVPPQSQSQLLLHHAHKGHSLPIYIHVSTDHKTPLLFSSIFGGGPAPPCLLASLQQPLSIQSPLCWEVPYPSFSTLYPPGYGLAASVYATTTPHSYLSQTHTCSAMGVVVCTTGNEAWAGKALFSAYPSFSDFTLSTRKWSQSG